MKTTTFQKSPSHERFTIILFWDPRSPVVDRVLRRINHWAVSYRDVCEAVIFYSDPIDRNDLVQKYNHVRWVRLEDESVREWSTFAARALPYSNTRITVHVSPYVIPFFFDLIALANGSRNENNIAVLAPKRAFYASSRFKKKAKYVFTLPSRLLFYIRANRSRFQDFADRNIPVARLEIFSYANEQMKEFFEKKGTAFLVEPNYGPACAPREFLEKFSGFFLKADKSTGKEKFFYGVGKSYSFYPVKTGWFVSYKMMFDYIDKLFRRKKTGPWGNTLLWVFPAIHLCQLLVLPVLFLYPVGLVALFAFYYGLILLYAKSGRFKKRGYLFLIFSLFTWYFV
ncbi:MAG: hypothetical protein ABUK01_07245 [Leptospirales bacterium]